MLFIILVRLFFIAFVSSTKVTLNKIACTVASYSSTRRTRHKENLFILHYDRVELSPPFSLFLKLTWYVTDQTIDKQVHERQAMHVDAAKQLHFLISHMHGLAIISSLSLLAEISTLKSSSSGSPSSNRQRFQSTLMHHGFRIRSAVFNV